MTNTKRWELREDSPLWLISYAGIAAAALAGMGYLFIAWHASGDAGPLEHGRPLVAALIMGAILFPSLILTQLLGWIVDKRKQEHQ